MSGLESKLRRMAASLNDAALEALANKGLLRRAQKDLERNIEIVLTGEAGSTLGVNVGGFAVTISESGPASASCSCPAAGVCQHILAAVLFLQRAGPEAIPEAPPDAGTSAASPEQELLAITPEQIEQWAGKAIFRAGLKIAAQSISRISPGLTITIHFPALNAAVHFIPGGGLEGMIASGGKSDGRELIVAAVVAFQRSLGKEWVLPEDVSLLTASAGAPRSRSEVLASCQTLLAETLTNGLSRITEANRQRWMTLAVSSLGVNLPRLALSLRGIGEEAALVVARDARSDLARLFGRMAHTHALCTALENGGENPRADLVGLHRSRYDEIGHLDLVGAAAWPWQTASGYEGLTILFWDPSAKCWNSWTESRPTHQLGDFKATLRFTQPGPWEGAESPQQLARSAFRLMNARRNQANRLSSSSKSRALVTGTATLGSQDLDTIKDWTRLEQQFKTRSAIGLKESNPLDSVFALKPTIWRDRDFDTVTQMFSWALEDSQGEIIHIEIPYDELSGPGIEFLEKVPHDSLKDALVIGRIQQSHGGLTLFPYTLHLASGKIVHLHLDQVRTAAPKKVDAHDESTEVFETEEEIEPAQLVSPTITRLLEEIDDILLAVAEAGMGALNPLRLEKTKQIAIRTDRLGLAGLSASLHNFINHPKTDSLLRCAYVSLTHRRAMSLATG